MPHTPWPDVKPKALDHHREDRTPSPTRVPSSVTTPWPSPVTGLSQSELEDSGADGSKITMAQLLQLVEFIHFYDNWMPPDESLEHFYSEWNLNPKAEKKEVQFFEDQRRAHFYRLGIKLVHPFGELPEVEESTSANFICVFYVGLEDDQDFCLVKRILGKGGCNMKGVAQTFHSKVRLRGKGSGFLEGSHALELDAPLQLWLSCHEWMNYVGAVGALYELLRDLHKHYRRYARAQCMEPPALKIIYSEERRRDLDAERNSKLIHVEDQWARPSWPRRRWWTSTRGSYGNFPLLKKATKDSLQADAEAGSATSDAPPTAHEEPRRTAKISKGVEVVLPVGCDPTGKALPPCSWNVGGRRDSGNSWRHYPAGCMGDDCVKKPWHQLSWLKGFAPEVARRPGSVARGRVRRAAKKVKGRASPEVQDV
ncbi:unnamed protein product [Durusdinium trenchii]|uniref:KHDC4/BBP-like KH-domain type I domain-containing protein n=1 Tax=Durusdinium trenchii TaxID=1381693 RepID=A0ABP0QBI4_9DINO